MLTGVLFEFMAVINEGKVCRRIFTSHLDDSDIIRCRCLLCAIVCSEVHMIAGRQLNASFILGVGVLRNSSVTARSSCESFRVATNFHDELIKRQGVNEIDQICVPRLWKVHFERSRSSSRAVSDSCKFQDDNVKGLRGKLFLNMPTEINLTAAIPQPYVSFVSPRFCVSANTIEPRGTGSAIRRPVRGPVPRSSRHRTRR